MEGVTFSNNFTESNIPPWVFHVFKLYKRYQIAQSVSYNWSTSGSVAYQFYTFLTLLRRFRVGLVKLSIKD